MSVSRRLALSVLALGSLVLSACSTTNVAREEARNKIVQTSKMYCEFVNGDNNPDIDVAVNLAIGVKCDADRAFSMTAYRTPSDINGVLYCCGLREPKSEHTPVTAPLRREEPKEDKPQTTKPEAKLAPVAPAPVVPPAPITAPTAAPVQKQESAPAAPASAPTGTPAAQAAPTRGAASVQNKRPAAAKKAAPSQITFSGESDLDQ